MYARGRHAAPMIVTCPSCQTRFRFPPDRIGSAGARIRCSRCRGVFAVSPHGEARAEAGEPSIAPQPAAPAVRSAPSADPFLANLGPDPFRPTTAEALGPQPDYDIGGAQGAAEALQASLDDPGPSLYACATPLALEDQTPRPPPLPPSSRRQEQRPDDEAPRVEEATLAPAESPSASGPLEVSYPLPADLAPAAAPAQAEARAAGTAPAPAEETPRRRRAAALGAAAMDALSLALLVGLAAAVAGWRGELGRRSGGGSAESVTTARVTGGLFDTADGPPVLVVRGEVEARQPVDRVRVLVALLEGGRTIATAEGLAGAAADPEQVFAASSVEQVATLRRALDARAAGPLEAGARAPFLVVFPGPVPDLAGVEVRATAEPVRGR